MHGCELRPRRIVCSAFVNFPAAQASFSSSFFGRLNLQLSLQWTLTAAMLIAFPFIPSFLGFALGLVFIAEPASMPSHASF